MESSAYKDDLFTQGAKCYINDNFKGAVEKFSEILNSNPSDKFSALLYRSSAYIQLGNHTEALKDLEDAEKLNNNSFELYYKRGIAAFTNQSFLEASEYLKKALTLSTNSEQREKLIIWSNKLEIELEENNLNVDQKDQNLPSIMPNANSTSEFSNLKMIHNWYQTATHLILTLTANIPINPSSIDIKIEKKTLKICEKSSGNLIWEMNLSNSVLPDSCTVDVQNRKVEFKLKKEIDNFNWVTVDRAKLNEATPNFQPSYPTSSKVKKNWDSVEKEINKELNNDAKNDPNEGMMKLFREIYGNASEETRRAMIKSFQTSGGTVLSTNWDEVKEKDYEGKDRPEAPKGQEWRKDDN